MLVYACSSNPGKLREFALAARESNVRDMVIEPLPGLKQIEPPAENGTSFEENAVAKALYYSQHTREMVLADDSGLEVDALGGAPGVYSARYAGPEATDEANNNLLLRNLENVESRAARFICVLAVARQGEVITTAQGAAEGEILRIRCGSGGFGYDPLFFYPPLNRSFAELVPEEKFAVSHRGKALRALFRRLSEIRRNREMTGPVGWPAGQGF